MSSQLPWSAIDRPAEGFNVLLVDAEHPQRFRWGRDANGHYLLILDVESANRQCLEETVLSFSGIRVDFDVDADASDDQIEALIAGGTKYSAVFDMLTGPTPVTVGRAS